MYHKDQFWGTFSVRAPCPYELLVCEGLLFGATFLWPLTIGAPTPVGSAENENISGEAWLYWPLPSCAIEPNKN